MIIYGVTIGEKHSINDWNLILTNRTISPPEVQINLIEIPQRDGKLDLSDSLTGLVKYYNRIVTLEFAFKDEVGNYTARFSDILNYCHGKKMKIIFDDDLDNYYLGRINVDKCDVNNKLGVMTITAECDPYKYDIQSTDEMWLWDPFDFEEGVINEFVDIPVSGTETVTLIAKRQVTYPTISVNANMTVEFDGVIYNLLKGENKMYDILLPEGENTLIFRGNGTVTIRYRGGSL